MAANAGRIQRRQDAMGNALNPSRRLTNERSISQASVNMTPNHDRGLTHYHRGRSTAPATESDKSADTKAKKPAKGKRYR